MKKAQVKKNPQAREEADCNSAQLVIDFDSIPSVNLPLPMFSGSLEKIQLIVALAIARELSSDDKQALLAVAILNHKKEVMPM